jgi:multidrug efflux pump subunit AcrB
MNIAQLAIRKSTITWTLSILLLVVGYKSFNSLPRLEDPEFTIKDAIISTPYTSPKSSLTIDGPAPGGRRLW